MFSYEISGFSLDAAVRVESWDREGLERLIRYTLTKFRGIL